MAFQVGDIVKKITGIQKFEVMEVLAGSKYKCKYYPRPPYNDKISFEYAESDLELVT